MKSRRLITSIAQQIIFIIVPRLKLFCIFDQSSTLFSQKLFFSVCGWFRGPIWVAAATVWFCWTFRVSPVMLSTKYCSKSWKTALVPPVYALIYIMRTGQHCFVSPTLAKRWETCTSCKFYRRPSFFSVTYDHEESMALKFFQRCRSTQNPEQVHPTRNAK